MAKFSKGSVRSYSRQAYGRLLVDPLTQGYSRISKQSKFGPRKGSKPPGNQGTDASGFSRR